MEEAHDSSSYKNQIMTMLSELKDLGFKIIADISKRTLELFACQTMVELKNTLGIDIIRVDYGFTQEQIQQAMEGISLAVNASTINAEMMCALFSTAKRPLAIHNYYPRQETGLDTEFFQEKNKQLRLCGYDVAMFVAGDQKRRGPIFDGLPTLEHQRNLPPYLSFIEAVNIYGMNIVLLGDLNIEMSQVEWIMDYIHEGIISIPIHLEKKYEELYNKTYTIREDSGAYAFRFLESREYSTNSGVIMEQDNCIQRRQGALTMDNHLYKRYSGEIQLVYKALKADQRVNVIGQIDEVYRELVSKIRRGDRLRLVRRK
jgi:hypothetical protein